MPQKYAALVFDLPAPRFPDPTEAFELTPGLFLHARTDTLSINDDGFWREELGRGAWADISTEHGLALSCEMETTTPGALDQDNQALQRRLLNAYRIIPLVSELRAPFTQSFVFSGDGRAQAGVISATNVREIGPVDSWIRAHYQDHGWDDYFRRYEEVLEQNDLLTSWSRVLEASNRDLFEQTALRQIVESYRSFDEALKSGQLEFKMPNLVRAMEGILASWGEATFTDRFIHLLSPEPTHFGFIDEAELRANLSDLYRLRNDCVHCKPFGYSYRANHGTDITADVVATLEYIAEWGARRSILGCFTNDSLRPVLNSYYNLEEAWRSNRVEAHRTYLSDVC